MKVSLKLLLGLITLGLIVGCNSARLGVGLPEARLYENTTVPVTLARDKKGPPKPVRIPENLVTGTSTTYLIELNIPMVTGSQAASVGWGDMSMQKALKDGNISEVTYADGQILSILGIFTRAKLIVHGPSAE